MILSLNGVNGQLELYEDKVIIKRKGFLAKMTQGFTKGEKTIYLRQITSIQFKPGGILVNGYIQFTMAGSNERTKGAFEAAQDENAIMFKQSNNDIAQKIKDKIEELQKEFNRPQCVSTLNSTADELAKYKKLLDDGVINEDEFKQLKIKLLQKL